MSACLFLASLLELASGGLAAPCSCGSTHSVLGLNEGVVDGDNVHVIVLDTVKEGSAGASTDSQHHGQDLRVSEDDTSDATEAVDSDLDNHVCVWYVIWGGECVW